MAAKDHVRWFEDIRLQDVPAVGGKTASLGELRALLGDRVPEGFALTAQAYRTALVEAGVEVELRRLLLGFDHHDVALLAERAAAARRLVYDATGNAAICAEIAAAYRGLEQKCGIGVAVAVRSSATAEDLPTASFAGQHESFLNVHGEDEVVDACRRCFASIFTDRAIVYRLDNGFDHFKVALSVGVMKMVRSDLAASGVIFTLDTESGFRDVVFVTGSWGLGENIVQGKVDPDEFYVHKPTFRQGYRAVLSRSLGGKELRLVYARGHGDASTRNVPTHRAERERFCLADAEVLELADCAIRIEDHYSKLAGQPTPMDIEWAKDGEDGRLYVVQARPETVASQRNADAFETYALKAKGPVLITGRAVGEKIASGTVRVIADAHGLSALPPGRGAGRPIDEPRLGTGHEDGRGDRHQPRRPHLPRGDRRPRTRRAGGGRGRRRDRAAQNWRGRHGELRRRRDRLGLWRRTAVRGDADTDGRAAAAPHRDHGQSRQSGTRLPHGDAAE